MSESFSIYVVTSGTVSNSTYVLYMLQKCKKIQIKYRNKINKIHLEMIKKVSFYDWEKIWFVLSEYFLLYGVEIYNEIFWYIY